MLFIFSHLLSTIVVALVLLRSFSKIMDGYSEQEIVEN